MSRAIIKEIPLKPASKGLFAYVNKMDYERALKLSKTWFAHKSMPGDYTYYARADVYNKGKRSRVYLHRFVLKANKGDKVDHINGDGLNCTRKNLRFCTVSENAANRRKLQANNTSGYNGVWWGNREQKWLVSIQYRGKKKYIGSFHDKLEAAKAYNEKALELFGKFARFKDI